MKYLNSLYFLMLCLAITLSSCNDGIEPNDNAIQFGYETRTLESNYAEVHGDTATIWGYSNNGGWVYGSQDGLTATLNTTDKTFTVEGVDTENAPEYWSNDSYHFYSLWPPVSNSVVFNTDNDDNDEFGDGKGLHFTVKTKVSQIDQLMAYFTVSGNDAASRTAPVHFEYKHILSNLIFNVQKNTANVQDSIILLSFALHNVYYQGRCHYIENSTPDWAFSANNKKDSLVLYSYELNSDSTFETTPLYIDARVGTKINGTGGYLVIPQNLRRTSDDDVVSLSMAYGFVAKNSSKVYSKNYASVTIPISTIAQWEQNKKYTYNIYLAAESNDIIFGTPNVSSWNRRQGGSTIIVQ